MSNIFKLGVTDLPIIGTKGAPKKFKGKSSEVEILLRHMDRLYAKYNVTDDKDKVESITQYCSRSVRQFMEGLSSYITPNWTQFSKDLKKFYEADKDTRRYKVRDLENYIIESRSHGAFTSLASWMKYNRGFISIAGWLVQHQKITTKERAIYFWKGIPRAFRERLEVRLLGQDPNHDLNNPFDVSVVTKVAENILKRDRFDNDRLPSDDEDSDSEDSELDSDDSDSDSDDDEVTARHAKAKKRKSSIKKDRTKVTKRVKIKAPRASYESDSSSSEDEKPSKSSSGRSTPTSDSKSKASDKEFEDLIQQLNSMSLKDPSYATVYYKAYRINPIIKELVPTPSEQRRASTPPARSRDRGFERDVPPHLNGSNDNSSYSRNLTCFGCGKGGHSMLFCPELRELASKGIVKLDANRRWVMANGSQIIRNYMNEPLIQAVQRAEGTQSNLITIEEFNELYPVAGEEEVYAVQQYGHD